MRFPFPLALTVGTDTIFCQRISAIARRDPARFQRFAKRILQDSELVDLTTRFPGWTEARQDQSAISPRLVNWIAGRWAAKEAAKKAWGASLLSFKDLRVEVCAEEGVQIVCDLPSTGGTKPNEQVGRLSISHDGDYAVAVVIASPLHDSIKSELGRRKTAAAEKVSA